MTFANQTEIETFAASNLQIGNEVEVQKMKDGEIKTYVGTVAVKNPNQKNEAHFILDMGDGQFRSFNLLQITSLNVLTTA